jgi:hypothetical protein
MTLPLRHVAGAAHLAIESMGEDERLAVDLASAAIAVILSLSPPGQLAIRPKKSTERIRALANAFYEA